MRRPNDPWRIYLLAVCAVLLGCAGTRVRRGIADRKAEAIRRAEEALRRSQEALLLTLRIRKDRESMVVYRRTADPVDWAEIRSMAPGGFDVERVWRLDDGWEAIVFEKADPADDPGPGVGVGVVVPPGR